jgi:hypothetical protein
MPPSRIALWRGRAIEVTAHLIPRCLWTTASIDVFVDSQCVLRSGGKLAAIGGVSAQFYDSGATHDIELCWGRAQIQCFPIEIKIDGEVVARSKVYVDNWPLVLWPATLVAGAIFWGFWHVAHGALPQRAFLTSRSGIRENSDQHSR